MEFFFLSKPLMLRPAPNVVRESEGVFLGVILDEHLYMSWKLHISYLSSKVSRSMGNIYKSRSIKLLPTQTCSTYTLSTYLTSVAPSPAAKANYKNDHPSKSFYDAHTSPILQEFCTLPPHDMDSCRDR